MTYAATLGSRPLAHYQGNVSGSTLVDRRGAYTTSNITGATAITNDSAAQDNLNCIQFANGGELVLPSTLRTALNNKSNNTWDCAIKYTEPWGGAETSLIGIGGWIDARLTIESNRKTITSIIRTNDGALPQKQITADLPKALGVAVGEEAGWVMLRLVFHATGLTLYANGVQLATSASFAATTTNISAGGHTMALGGAGNGAQYWRGRMDEVAFFDTDQRATALSDYQALFPNTAPTVTKPTITTSPIRTTTTSIAATTSQITDANGDPCSVIWRLYRNTVQIGSDVNQAAAAVPINNRTVEFTAFGALVAGDLITIKAVANDGTATTESAASDAVTVQAALNAAPVMATIADQTIHENRTNVTIRVTATDADGGGDIAGFSLPNLATEAPNFTLVSNTRLDPSGNSRSADIVLRAGISDARTAAYPITVRVADAAGATGEAVMNVFVVNDAPVPTPIDNQSLTEGAIVEIPISATDANGHDLTFAIARCEKPLGNVIATPAWVTIIQDTPTTGRIRLAPPVGAAATHSGMVIFRRTRDGA